MHDNKATMESFKKLGVVTIEFSANLKKLARQLRHLNIITSINGYSIVNRRGRNKLVDIRRRDRASRK